LLKETIEKEFGFFKTNTNKETDLQIEFAHDIPKPTIKIFPYYGILNSLFYLYINGVPLVIPFYDYPNRIIVDERLLPESLIDDVIEPLILLGLIPKGHTFLHASAVEKNGEALVFSAWPHTGKTNSLIYFMKNSNEKWSFLANEYCLISNKGEVLPYPRLIRIFGYNIDEYPELLDEIYSNAPLRKVRYKMKHAFENMILRRTPKIEPSNKLEYILYYGLELLKNFVGTEITCKPEDLQWNIGKKSMLTKLFLMIKYTGNKLKMRRIRDKKGLSLKLAANVLWEKEFIRTHYLAYLFAAPSYKNQVIEDYLRLQQEIIHNALQAVECYEIMLPQNASHNSMFKRLENLFDSKSVI
jgi:hypothetical protein